MNSDFSRDISISDLFQVEEIQRVQDAFAQASNVASIITAPDGRPLTCASNVGERFAMIVQGRDDFARAGVFSDAVLGPYDSDAPVIRVCPVTGLLHAGARIRVGGIHVANWIVGHVRDEDEQAEQLLALAGSRGISRESFAGILDQLPRMGRMRLGRVADSMVLIAGHIFEQAFRNMHLRRDEFKEEHRRFPQDAEKALLESEARYRSVIENIQDTFYRTDAGGALIMLSPSGARLLGYDAPEELLGTSMEKLWKSADAFQEYVQILSEQGVVRGLEATLLRKDGSEVLVEATSNIYSDDSGFMLGLEGILRDITERKKTEELLRQSENKFSRLFRHSPDAILLADIDTGIVSEVNETFVTMMGYARDEIIGKTTDRISFYVDPALWERLYAMLRRDGLLANQELMVRTRDGRNLMCALSSHVLQIGEQRVVMSVFRDITELKKMQEMMIQTEKMLSVGGIAAGIAHEINNPLGIIMQSAQLLELRTLTDFPKNIAAAEKIGLDLKLLEGYMNERNIPTCVRDIREAAKRAADIIRHMLDFSRRSDSDRKFCFVNEIIDRAITMAGSDYDLRKSFDFKRIKLIRDFADPMPGIHCCETEIEQVVLNLLRNAAQAMGGVADLDPVITVRTRVEGENIVIEVEDNGPGIPPETARRIFEPFFTTKPPGQGTGLGLSVSYFIVTQTHGGSVQVKSDPGRTCFHVELPLVVPASSIEEP